MPKKATRGRAPDSLRPVKIVPRYLKFPPGSALIQAGNTHVICSASVEDGVPSFLEGRGRGWVTAEYDMIPGSTQTRKTRSSARGRPDGRGQEIQRLIGRSMRAAVDLEALGRHTIWLDCDVIQADGGTRTASITGAYVALVEALKWMQRKGRIQKLPLKSAVAGVSVGMVDGAPTLDLSYAQDLRADVDLNVVMTSRRRFVEVQGTAEGDAFSQAELGRMLALARKGCTELFRIQQKALDQD